MVGFRPRTIITGIIALILGTILPWITTFISANEHVSAMHNSTENLTGAAFFLFFGFVLNLIGIPIIGLIFCVFGVEKTSKNLD